MAVSPERRRRFRRTEDRDRERALQRRPNRAVKRAAIGLLVLVAGILAVAVLSLGIGSVNDRHALERATRALGSSEAALSSARAAIRQGVQTRQLAAAIQASRYTSILEQCRGQNARHDLTIARLDRGIARALRRAHDRRRRAELRDSRAFSVGLIEALAPRQDCGALAGRDAGPVRASG